MSRPIMSSTPMAEPATRVALLARPGNACDRLHAALQDAGADVVLVADPNETDVGSVHAAAAQAVLIALEPTVEDALDRFDALLADPTITVIFDEAELAAQREGWDAARWVRHLAAKLKRNDDVLPPGTEAEIPSEGMSQHPESDLDIGALALEFETLAAAMPGDRGPGQASYSAPPALADPMAILAPDIEMPQLDDASNDDHLADDRFHRDLDELHERIATMELVDAPRTVTSLGGAVLVLAGIGGPDAVRQLLGGLSADFPRPVLIQQRLDGARHDKLVRQMQRATSMPVHLAAHGQMLQRGHVYILPAELGLVARDNALRFQQGGDLFASLPAEDSAVIMLSGSDPACADAVMGLSWGGALVAGQMPEGCYDATAAEALIARGAESGPPLVLAKRLAARWPA